MPKLLEEEVAYYREHRAELADRHTGEFVVVKDRRLLGAFPTLRAAYAAAAAQAPKQPALITRLPTSAERAAAREAEATGLGSAAEASVVSAAQLHPCGAVRHAIARICRDASVPRIERRAS